MNEFNAQQYYGYSPQNDPDLATTTKNFEFRYIRPEFLERAIQRVHKEQHIAGKNEQQLDKKYCPHHSIAAKHDPKLEVLHNDVAVNEPDAKRDTQFVRDLSKQEIECLIKKVKDYVQTSPRTSKIPQNHKYPREGNQIALDHLSFDLTEGQHSIKNRDNRMQGNSKISPREVNRYEFHHIAQHSLNTKIEDSRTPTAISALGSPSGKCKGIFRQFSQDKTYDQQQDVRLSPKIVSHQYGQSNNATVNVVSTATSPLISPRMGGIDWQAQPPNQEESFTSPTNYPKVSTATSPITSPRRETCGILRKSYQEDIQGRSVDLNKTYNLFAGYSNFNQNRTRHIVDYMEVCTQQAQVPQIFDNVRMEKIHKPQAKWVDILETAKENRKEIEVQDKRNKSTLLKSSRPETPQNFEVKGSPKTIHNRQLGTHNCLPTLLMTEVIKDNVRQAGGCVNVSGHGEYQEAVETVILEDSDMEFEIMERPHYTKYIKSKPKPEEMLSLSAEDEGGLAKFLEIESGNNELDVRYLRNASPLSFTEITEDEPTQNINQMKIYINGKYNQPILRSTDANEVSESPFILSTPERCSSPSQTLKETKRRGKSLREQHLQRTFERLARRGSTRDTPPPCPSNSTADQFQPQRAHSYRARTNFSSSPQATRTTIGSCTDRSGLAKKDKPKSSGRRVLPTQLRISKSIEDQKSEKTYIFQKMADIQVKIIEVLDKLKISLLELNVPKNVYEKSKRQKNALEFAVRFSRNFLYPLKGLLEELKLTPLEQFNSLFSNEACNRVCYIYNLLLQSLNTYQKQLRYFHLDHVPQKLPTLIEIIHTTTVLCLEKSIFSRQDERITFLQQSCNKFLDFLQELQDGHLNTARENYRKLTLEKASPKYELKMVMNPLNMYEPKLVPKVEPTTARKKTKNKRHITSVAIDETKDDINEKPQDDKIPTHVQSYPVEAKSSACLQTESAHQLNLGSGDGVLPGLDKSILQAMRHMTQEQVRTILDPILKTLSSALGHQGNPEMFEAIFNAFNNKVFSPLEAEKQLNDDNKCSPGNQTAIEETAPTTTTSTRETALRSQQAFGDVESTCKPLKVANRTKTQRQQNSRPTRATNRKNSANAITTTTAATSNVAATAAVIIVGDDDYDSPNASHNISNNNDSNSHNNNNTNDHTKTNANNLRLSSGNNNSRHQHSTGPDCRANGGELTHKPNGGELTTMASVIINREESQINKTFKLMNEVVNEDSTDEKLPPEDKKQQQQQHQQTADNQHTNKSQTLRTTKRAPQHDHRDRLRRSRRQQPLNKYPCSSSSSFSTDSDDDEKHQINQLTRSKNVSPSKFSKHQHQLRDHHSHHSSNNNILTSNKQDSIILHSSKAQLETTTFRRDLRKPSSHRKLTKQQKRYPLLAVTPPAPSVTPTSSRSLQLSPTARGFEEIQDHLLLRNMPIDSLNLHIPLTSSASALRTGRTSDKQGGGVMEAEEVNYKIGRSASVADYGKEFKKNLSLKPHNSPYDNTPDNNTPRRLRPLPEKEMRKLKPKPTPSTHPEPLKTKFDTTEINHPIAKENQSPRKDKFRSKNDFRIDSMIQERDRFLKLCEKNRFYNNPNYSEPWKIFSVISERLLNDMLDTEETDFNDVVSKFVQDFLELETKTQ